MDAVKDGGRAFPNVGDGDKWDGMTLRDYFASKAMQGFWASHFAKTELDGRKEPFTVKEVALWAYSQADAMIAERGK